MHFQWELEAIFHRIFLGADSRRFLPAMSLAISCPQQRQATYKMIFFVNGTGKRNDQI